MKLISLFVLIAVILAFVSAEEKKETLVLLDNLATRETHSIFFKNLQGKNFASRKRPAQHLKIIFLRSRFQINLQAR